MATQKDFKTWVYHPTEAPKIVMKSEAEELYSNGWADSPAKFFNFHKDGGVDMENPAHVQAAGETTQGVVDFLNGAINLEVMSKKDLEAYAKKHFQIDLDLRKSQKNLAAEVKQLIEAE